MDDTEYKHWWTLHVRAARGEELTEGERVAYEAGLRELQDEEVLASDLSSLREVREAVSELDAKYEELQQRRHELKAEVARLEAGLSEEERKRLGIED